jgi:DNA-binding transcriptional LysR family regulator
VPTVSCVISARLARRTVDTYPGISLCIVESYSGHLMEWLHRGEMDLALIYGPSSDLHLSVQSLAAVTPSSPWARAAVGCRKGSRSISAGCCGSDWCCPVIRTGSGR